MTKLRWRVKLVAECEPGVTTEPEFACIERNAQASVADLGLTLAETKRRTRRCRSDCADANGGSARLSPSLRRVRAPARGQGPLRSDVPLPVRRRSGAGAALVRLSVPEQT